MKSKMRACSAATALVLLTLSGWSSAAGGTYYRWTDASGTEVNSDRPPPPGTEYEVVSTTTNRMYQEVPDDGTVAPGDPPAGSREQKAVKSPATPVRKKDPEQCAAANKNLETLNTHLTILVPDDKGGHRYLDEDEKATQRTIAESIIAQDCE